MLSLGTQENRRQKDKKRWGEVGKEPAPNRAATVRERVGPGCARTLPNGPAPLGPFPHFADYFDALFAYFARTAAWQLYPETFVTLTALAERGFQLGVISNFDSRLFGLLDGFDLTRFFDPIVISTHAGAAKPEGTIFAQALARHGFRPEDALHVGDSLHADIVGARAVGMIPVLIDRKATTEKMSDYLRINSLAELLKVDET